MPLRAQPGFLRLVATLLGAILVTPLTAQVAAISASAPTSSSAPVNISGVVLNANNGGPISRVLVQIGDRAVLTDHEGKFEFDQFPAAAMTMLTVRKPGFYFNPEASFGGNMGGGKMFRADQLAKPVVVQMYPEALMTGTLTSTGGSPLTQVNVSAMRSMYNDLGHQWLPVAHSLTNSHGEFRLAVPPGDYRIETNFSTRLQNSSDAVLPLIVPSPSSSDSGSSIHMSSGTEQKFDLHPVVSRTYTVGIHIDPVQEQAFPVIFARSSDGTVFPARIVRSGSGPNNNDPGGMKAALPGGTFTLMASMNWGEDMEYGEASVTVTDHDISEVVLHLTPVAPIPVQVIVASDSASDKAPPKPEQLGLMMQNVQDSSFRMNQNFPVLNLGNRGAVLRPAPGVYRLTARFSGQWFVKSATFGTTDMLQQDVIVTAGGGSSPIVLTVSDQTGSLQGTVTENNAPMSSWIYAVPSGSSLVPVYTTHSGTDGGFNFNSLPPGTYQVVAFPSSHSVNYRDPKALSPYSTYIRSVTVSQGNKATVDLNSVSEAEIKP